jgi:hypothetical protein
MFRRLFAASALVIGLASCGGSGSSGATTTTEVTGSFSNDCERILSTFAVDLIVSYGDMTPVKAEWPDNSSVQDLLEAVYLIAKPLVDKVSIGPAVNYMNEIVVNSCRDNDVFNWVQKLEPSADGYRSDCLDDALPKDIAKVEWCPSNAPATTTTAP